MFKETIRRRKSMPALDDCAHCALAGVRLIDENQGNFGNARTLFLPFAVTKLRLSTKGE
jgi:hypothetical protein